MNRYRKLITPVAALLVTIGEALSDGALDTTETATILGAVVVIYGVWRLPNEPPAA